MKNNKDFKYAKSYYNNDSLLDKFWAKNWLYLAWVIEIIAIIIYVKMLYWLLCYIMNALLTGKIHSFRYYGFSAIIDSLELLAIQFIEWIFS